MRSLYYYALAGALAGLLGWYLAATVVASLDLGAADISAFIFTGAIGFFLGAFLCSIERIWDVGLLRPAAWSRDFILGAFWGLAGGLLGGFAMLHLFSTFKISRPEYGRVLGTSALGMIIGIAESLRWGSTRRLVNGALGGTLGGILGGLVFQRLAAVSEPVIPQALAFLVLGGSVGAFVSFIVTVGADAYLEGVAQNQNPKYQGAYTSATISRDAQTALGTADTARRTPKANIQIDGDPHIDALHAIFSYRGRQWWIRPGEPPYGEETYVNGAPVLEQTPIENGDLLVFGKTYFVFRARR